MSYQVIARRCRPETFEEVIGQPHVARTLQNAIRLGRIAHAYLFSGARGVGKTSVARILAKALNCEKGPAPSPCNQCSNCREISHSNSVDVLEIDGASNTGIDNIRELKETARYRPAKGRYKVYIIDEVHQLSTAAFNGLLKILEEPPAHVIFIFATTEPHKIPATVLSRCQRFEFRRLGLQMIVEHLKKIVSQDGAHFSDSILYAIGREADGSMRDAQSLLEQLMAFSGDDLNEFEILDILGVIDRQSVMRAAEAILAGDAGACLQIAGDVYRRGLDSRRFCQHLCDHFRNLIFVTLSAGAEGRVDLPGDEDDLLRQMAAGTTLESLHVFFQMLLQGEEDIRRSSMPKIVLEMLLLRMSRLPELESIEQMLEKLATIEQNLKAGQSPPDCMLSESRPIFKKTPARGIDENKSETKPIEPDAGSELAPPSLALSASSASPAFSRPGAPPPTLAEAVADWQSFVNFLESRDAVWGIVSHCTPRVSGQSIELEVPEIFENSTNGPKFISKLEETALAFWGEKFQWTITRKQAATSRGSSPREQKVAKPSGAKHIAGHQAVQQAIEILGAELREVKTSPGAPRERRGK
ncbi:MAG: DNA polymerase III subunit gamma/tau [Syntrophobacteraceae bacterium]